jgi:hypothetical protein
MSDALLHLSTYPSGLFSAKTHSQYTCKAPLPVVISFIYFILFDIPSNIFKAILPNKRVVYAQRVRSYHVITLRFV